MNKKGIEFEWKTILAILIALILLVVMIVFYGTWRDMAAGAIDYFFSLF